MIFSSLLFVFAFLPIAIGLFFIPRLLVKVSSKSSLIILTAVSILFYFIGSGKYLLIFLVSIILNFYCGELIVKTRKNKNFYLVMGVFLNLLLLGYFKYTRFTFDSLSSILGVGLFPELQPYLPIGISFYTFMGISYIVDCYKNKNERGSFLEYATYITFFPHLIAGPIVRFREISHQIRNFNLVCYENFVNGCFRFSLGFAMKVILADNMAVVADNIFNSDIKNLNPASAWLGCLAYTFQIYFDFAGYSAMAIGLALIFGVKFPENFNYPYLSSSISEFWRRWHISLSSWLRDYLYIPLGGNRRSVIRNYVNLLVVFLICGLWHGAAWTFVVWGFYHGVLLILERGKFLFFNSHRKGFFGIVLTFILVMIGWIIFRSPSIEFFLGYIGHLFFINNELSSNELITRFFNTSNNLFYFTLLLCGVFSFGIMKKFPITLILSNKITASFQTFIFIILFIISTIVSLNSTYKPFIYFRF